MADPFLIDGPTCISFSGGRTSGYMVWRVLQANGGNLPADTVVCFANTGKEDEATLQFVRDVEDNLDVPVVWLEFRDDERGYAIVDFETASRNGEPFEAAIRKRNFLPNPVARFCTIELKIQPEHKFLRGLGWTEWDNLVGIRADEPRRVAKIRANPSGGKAGPDRRMPLADAGVTKEVIGWFWKQQLFDLGLPSRNGVTLHGNCDLCFLKPAAQVLSLIAEKPERAKWWAKQEGSITNSHIQNGGTFRTDRPTYAQMAAFAADQRDIFDPDEEAIACFCGD